MALTLEQMQENIQALRANNFSDDDIELWIKDKGFPAEIQQRIDKAKKFEKSALGTVLGLGSKPLQWLGIAEPTSKTEERLALSTVKGNNILKQAGKESLRVGAAVAPLVVGGSKSVQGLPLLKRAITQGAVSGISAGVEQAAKGKDGGEVVNDSLITALIGAGTELTAPLVAKVAKSLFASGSRVNTAAVNRAMKKPSLLTEAPDLEGVKSTFRDKVKSFSKSIKETYNNSIDSLDVPEGTIIDLSKPIKGSNSVKQTINSLEKKKGILAKKLKSSADRNIVNIGDNAIDRFVAGGNLTFDEAKQINSLMFDITDAGVFGKDFETGGITKIRRLKKALLATMESEVNGIKDINKEFAMGVSKYDDIVNDFFKKGSLEEDIKENVLLGVGKQVLGGKGGTETGKRSQIIKRLMDFDKDLVEEIGDVFARDAFDNAGYGDLMDYLTLTTGASLGSSVGGAPGALVGALGSQAVRDPRTTKSLIKTVSGQTGQQMLKSTAPIVKRLLQRQGVK